MKKIVLVFLVFFAFAMHAQVTQVAGNQSGEWSGEIHVTNDVVVPAGETLTVEAGTTVIADGYFEILVRGSIYANGDENARISFTVADTTGYSDYDNVSLGAWKGFTFRESDVVRLSYCDFSYGKTKVDSDGGAARFYDAGDVEISHCTFHHNTMRKRGGAIYAENSVFNIHDCEVYDNFGTGYEGSYTWGVGFQFLKCDIDMHDMVFHDNIGPSAYGGGMNVDSCNLTLRNAVFHHNRTVCAGGLGIQRCKDYTVKVSNMLAYKNYVMHYGGGLATADSNAELNNLTIVDNYCGGGGGAGMQTAFDANPVLNNCIFWGNHAIMNIVGTDTMEYYYGSQIWLWGASCFPVFNYGLVQYGLDSINNGEYLPEGHYNDMIDVNPLFVNALTHDYRLSEGSPCVDTGVTDTTGLFIPATDLAGGARIVNNRIDMGCYEFGNSNVDEVAFVGNIAYVFPNPLNDNSLCVFSLGKKSDVTIRLVSLDGKEVYKEDCGTLDAGVNRISLEAMLKNLENKNTMYLLIIDTQEDKFVNKIIY